MGLVAIKAGGGGLVALARLGIHHRDDPAGSGALEDPEAAVRGLLMSWPLTVANSTAASATRGASRSPRKAWPAR
jgi:hypothetical protein